MAIVRWRTDSNPFRELERLRGDIDRLFTEFEPGGETFFGRVYPAVNISEDGKTFYIKAELPGVNSEDLDVSFVDGSLVIRGERKISPEKPGMSYHRRERQEGTFRRIISMPEKVDPDKVSARLQNGVLTVTLPKAAEAKPRKISVKTS